MDNIKKFIHKWVWILLVVFCVVGILYPVIGSIALVCMLAPVITAFFRGRMWCGNFCPRGSFNDIMLSRISLNRVVPMFFKKKWFKNLFLVCLMSAFIIQLYFSWGSFYTVGLVFVRMILSTTLITILLGIIFKHRTWCMICPMGTMAQYVSKLDVVKSKIKHITFKADKCVNCNLCSKSCPMEIGVLNHKNDGKVLDANCLKCNVCVEKCSKKSLKSV